MELATVLLNAALHNTARKRKTLLPSAFFVWFVFFVMKVSSLKPASPEAEPNPPPGAGTEAVSSGQQVQQLEELLRCKSQTLADVQAECDEYRRLLEQRREIVVAPPVRLRLRRTR